MAVNPQATIQFLDGQLQPALNLATSVALKMAVATGGAMLRPILCSQTSSVLQFLHGPLVSSGAHHVTYSGPAYFMRLRASLPGSIGTVTKTPATTSPSSVGDLATSLSSYTLHAQVDTVTAASALNLTSGWSAPAAPLPVTVTAGAGTVLHTQTFTYVDDAGDVQTGTLSVTGVGAFTTSFTAQSIIKVTSNVAPVGVQDYAATFTTPGDRYEVRVKTLTGGVVGVTGGVTPQIQISLDDGRTFSRTQSLPSSGILELLTYAGGLQPQATGVTLTVSNGTSLASQVFGSLRVAGATVPGDVLYTKKVSGAVTVQHVVAGNNTVFSVQVVGLAITVNSATNGGGVATSTANDVAAGIMGTPAAAALVSALAVGAGTGLMANAAAAGFANSGIDYTAKQEGVQVRHGNLGPSNPTITVLVANKQITVNPVTDANGIQTSTATQLATAVNASPTASLLLAAVATGAGSGLVGMQGTYIALATTLATGDQFTFTTTPPKWSNVDLVEAQNILLANDAALDGFSMIHIVGDAADLDVQTTQTWLDNLDAQKRKYKGAYHDATYMGATTESTWLTATLAGYTKIDTNPRVGIGAGEANILNPAYGTIDRRSVTTPYMARLMICSISELPSHVDCFTDFGIQNALAGVAVRTSTTTQIVPPLWQSDDTLVTLNTNNFVTLRTLAGRTGIYVRQGLMYTTDSDYTFVTNRRTADVVAAVAYDEILRNLNANLLVDTKTGQLAEVEMQRIENNVTDRVRREVMGGARQHISGVLCVLDRGTNFQATGEISGDVRIVGRTAATSIKLRLGYVRTIGQALVAG